MNSKTSVEGSSCKDLETLADEALQLMERLGYSRERKKECRRVWKSFISFAKENNIDTLSEDLYKKYIACFEGPGDKPLKDQPRRVRANVLMLMDFARCGYWRLRCNNQPEIILPELFTNTLNDFLKWHSERKQFHPTTLKNQKRYLIAFLRFMEAKGFNSFDRFHPDLLSDFFISQAHLKPRSIQSIAGFLKDFLVYLHEMKIVPRDYSPCIPTIRIPMEQHLPKTWPKTEVDALLAAVDRSSPMGKRDYAILMLACRLGMRAGDIRNLRLENLKWDEARIVLTQGKTGNPLTLPLLEEVGEAIIDYLRHGRPSTDYREIFMRTCAPFAPLSNSSSLYAIVTTYRRQAGLSLQDRERRGMHSFRHTVACRLLETDTPFEMISDILGHASLESTHIYAKVNLSALRDAVLDPEEVFHNA